jgi:hypothetical protein
MSRINKFLSSVMFRRIFIIFVVGLVSRLVVNLVFDINVFKDYMSYISLIYYMCMACFVGFVHELPSISFNVFNFKLVKSAIRSIVEDSSLIFSSKILSNDNMFIDNMKMDKMQQNSVFKQDNSERTTYGRISKFKSAGVRGLYGDPENRGVIYGDLVGSTNKHSFNNKVKLRVM